MRAICAICESNMKELCQRAWGWCSLFNTAACSLNVTSFVQLCTLYSKTVCSVERRRGGEGGWVGGIEEREHNIGLGDKGGKAGAARVTAEIHFLQLGAELTKKSSVLPDHSNIIY